MIVDQFAVVNGVRLHYLAAGDGPLIIFLHGFPEFSYAWRKYLAEFSTGHLAVAPDMRGYNLSDKPPRVDQYAMKHLVEDVGALATHLGHEKFVLAGHDWGGAIAWSFAIAHPERLSKLVVVNGPHPGIFDCLLRNDPVQQKASQYMLMFRSARAEEILSADNYAAMVGIVFGRRMRNGLLSEEDEREKQAYLNAWSQPGALTGGLNYYRAAKVSPGPGDAHGNFAVDPAILTVSVPTLVIWAEDDVALPTSNLDGLDQYVPQLTVKRVPNASHWVIHEKPAEVNSYIRDFLR
jgi:pimeloyl-ACP methyl ester carboxylesterase